MKNRQELFRIIKRAWDNRPIANAVRAYGETFVDDLIEYVEEYPSGHSMQYTIMRDIFKNLKFSVSHLTFNA